MFLEELEKMFTNVTVQVISKMDPKDIIKKFYNSAAKHYENVEMIVHGILVASIKVSVESVAKFMISRYNLRNSDIHQIGEDSAHEEMMISCNGPSLGECDRVIKAALDKYFIVHNTQQNGEWHFLTRAGQQDIKLYGKVEKRVLSQKSKLSFMK